MNRHSNRLSRIEERLDLNKEKEEPWFIEWFGNPWLPEEKEEVLARHPDAEVFMKSMMAYPPYYREEDGPEWRTLNNSRYGARKMSAYERKQRKKHRDIPDPEAEKYLQVRIQDLRDFMNEAKGLPPRPDKEPVEPVFSEDPDIPWTEEEKAEVLARHPDCNYFRKVKPGYGSRKSDDPPPRTSTGDCYEATKMLPWVTYSLEGARRVGYIK